MALDRYQKILEDHDFWQAADILAELARLKDQRIAELERRLFWAAEVLGSLENAGRTAREALLTGLTADRLEGEEDRRGDYDA